MDVQKQHQCLSIIYPCVILSFLISNAFLTVYILIELQTLRVNFDKLQQDVVDNSLRIQTCSSASESSNNVRDSEAILREGRQLASHDLISELLQSQAHILQSHCTNNSRLCMAGPQGAPGPKGEKGDPGPAIKPNTTCACLVAPTINISNLTQHIQTGGRLTTLDCPAAGDPQPFITWAKNSVRINHSGDKQVRVTSPGNYTCTAENMVGVATATFYVT